MLARDDFWGREGWKGWKGGNNYLIKVYNYNYIKMDDEIKAWFKNTNSVIRNLSAFGMAQKAINEGKNYSHKYNSPCFSKTYNAQQLVDIMTGNNSGSYDDTDEEYRALYLMRGSLTKLYSGLKAGQMLNSTGGTYNTRYKSQTLGSSVYGNASLNTLYGEGMALTGKVNYPLTQSTC